MIAEDFLPLADKLAQGGTEAEWRTAIGRAYYTAFHRGRALLGRLGFRAPREERAHKFVVFRLSNCDISYVTTAGEELDDLRTQRNKADYDLHHAFDRDMAIEMVATARRVIKAFDDALRDSSSRDTLTRAIREYERDVLKDPTWQPPKK